MMSRHRKPGVVPEHIFMTGLGELFVIRVAGNVVGPSLVGVAHLAESRSDALGDSHHRPRFPIEGRLDSSTVGMPQYQHAALRRLVEGNRIYVEALDHERDLSQERIADLFENGQRPFACVITCADSRVVPEHIFISMASF